MTHSDPTFLPESVYKHFLAITQRSHPSANQRDVTGNEDPVREYVNAQAQDIANVTVVHYEKDATEPGQRVIVLSRAGSGSHAEKTPVILQAHMDMVYNPVDMEFPLDVIVHPNPPGEGKWIKAREKNDRPSTLGADDGIGVATALAILQDENLKDYPLECLFTVQEETNMGGAQNFNLSYLNGRQLLNLDAEDLDIIIYGAAGGCSTQ
ncbi:MAG: aminoacyl-histidine dipeptidase [Proteobacteria bacterium]|nr:aminoacyl-histidine dipeptidase [Pseudomonadota bacterium]